MFLFENVIYTVNFMAFFFFIIPFILTITIMPPVIRKMRETGYMAKDMYKINTTYIPINGGLVILLVALFSLSIISLFYSKYINPVNYAIITVVALFAFFGLLDDIINIGRIAKLVLLYYCAYILISYATVSILYTEFFSGILLFGIIYSQIIVPTYVPVVANLVNMHSGFNGLAPGLSLIILITLILKSLFFGDILNILFIICLTGALAGYFLFEKYPARIFWGNIGALTIGAAIGATIVIEGYIVSGFIMLIPHTINFLMYVYWRLRTDKYPIQKFGKIREDGTLEVPNPLTLKWLLPYYYPMTEKQATNVMLLYTTVFCFIGLFVPG
ncbi:MAG: UDP-N-acetylglucosamine-1-phosphate transferase [Methanocalculus sp.]|nr:UDP-N-acetylglucosamine-1-phosphate transferase [Methanocalculus sp.]MDG6250890.1 UDP-N-acetylglucosamine-1-phosphate transferase [Methanocalculus sp.]